MLEKIKVLLSAVPTYGAVVTAALGAVSATVIPELPGPWQAQAAAVVAAVAGFVASVVAVVSRVKPIVSEAEKGLVAAREAVDVEDLWA